MVHIAGRCGVADCAAATMGVRRERKGANMHPYFLYDLYKTQLNEVERRAEVQRIFLEGRERERREPGVLARATGALRLSARHQRRSTLRTDAYACR
jgi:hypothetical protein